MAGQRSSREVRKKAARKVGEGRGSRWRRKEKGGGAGGRRGDCRVGPGWWLAAGVWRDRCRAALIRWVPSEAMCGDVRAAETAEWREHQSRPRRAAKSLRLEGRGGADGVGGAGRVILEVYFMNLVT